MIPRRTILWGAASLLFTARSAFAAAEVSPIDTVQSLSDTLLEVMKQGSTLGFAGRRERLAPIMQRVFDLPLMTRLMVGVAWQRLTDAQRNELINAFTNFSIATYANRFDDYSGERFQINPVVETSGNNTIVHTKLVKSDGEPVQIDYVLRAEGGPWQIVDVYLSGTVSELATRRSEFTSILRRDGADALVAALQRKTAQLGG